MIEQDDNDVSPEIKRTIIGQEIQMHRNTVYLLGLRCKANKRLGNSDGVLKEKKHGTTRDGLAGGTRHAITQKV